MDELPEGQTDFYIEKYHSDYAISVSSSFIYVSNMYEDEFVERIIVFLISFLKSLSNFERSTLNIALTQQMLNCTTCSLCLFVFCSRKTVDVAQRYEMFPSLDWQLFL